MEVLINRKVFLQVIKDIKKIKFRKLGPDILNYVHFICEKGIVSIYATNLDVGINKIVNPVFVKSEGEVLLPIKRVYDILKNNVCENVKIIQFQSNEVLLVLDSVSYKMIVPSVHNFPLLPKIDKDSFQTVNSKDIKSFFESVEYAADKTNYSIDWKKGVSLYKEDQKLIALATDSKRLSVNVSSIPLDLPAKRVFIPFDNMTFLLKFLKKRQHLQVGFSEFNSVFKYHTLTSKDVFSINETYIFLRVKFDVDIPSYTFLLHLCYDIEVNLNRNKVKEYLKNILKIIGKKEAILSFIFHEGVLTLKVKLLKEIDCEIQQTLEIQCPEFQRDFTFALRFNYIADVINAIDVDEFTFHKAFDSLSPCMINSCEMPGFSAFIMPFSL